MTNSYIPIKAEHLGYAYSYSCQRLNETLPELNKTTVTFDFEFVLPDPGEPIAEVRVQDMPLVEFGILHRLTAVSGISSCSLENQQQADPLKDDTTAADNGSSPTLSQSNVLLGISSRPPDVSLEGGTFACSSVFRLLSFSLTGLSICLMRCLAFLRYLQVYYRYSREDDLHSRQG